MGLNWNIVKLKEKQQRKNTCIARVFPVYYPGKNAILQSDYFSLGKKQFIKDFFLFKLHTSDLARIDEDRS